MQRLAIAIGTVQRELSVYNRDPIHLAKLPRLFCLAHNCRSFTRRCRQYDCECIQFVVVSADDGPGPKPVVECDGELVPFASTTGDDGTGLEATFEFDCEGVPCVVTTGDDESELVPAL
jgi:hypothetical protein